MSNPSNPLNFNQPVYLEFQDGRSHKFYEVTVTDCLVSLRYGRIGSNGQTFNTTYPTRDAAQSIAEQKINEKLNKGYRRLNQTPTPSSQPVVDSLFSAPSPVLSATFQTHEEFESLFAEVEALLAYFNPDVICWHPPATEAMIVNAEQQLGTQFPPSLRAFFRKSNGFELGTWFQVIGLPQIGEESSRTMVRWSLSYRDNGAPQDFVVVLDEFTGDSFGLLSQSKDEWGECAITKVCHESLKPKGIFAASFERLLWFVIKDHQRFVQPDGEFKFEDMFNNSDETDYEWSDDEEEYDEDWHWYEDLDYCLQHDPGLRYWQQ